MLAPLREPLAGGRTSARCAYDGRQLIRQEVPMLRPITRLALVIAMLAAGHAATSAAHPPARATPAARSATRTTSRSASSPNVAARAVRRPRRCCAPTSTPTRRARARRARARTSAGRAEREGVRLAPAGLRLDGQERLAACAPRTERRSLG